MTQPSTELQSSALRRIIRRPAKDDDAVPRCQLCGAMVAERHRHMLDEQRGEPLCTCHACSLLFERDAAGRDHYRLIPDRRVRLPGFPTGELGVPVGLVFFVRQADGTVVANYPSAIGITQHEVDDPAWQAITRTCPDVEGVEPVVEAVLVNTARGAQEHWIVPIDDCYRLIAVIRQEWRGLSGGTQVWPAIDRFFEELATNPYRHC